MSPSENLTQRPTSTIARVASLGGGVIGQSWTSLFLAAGKTVTLFDPDPAAESRVKQAIEDSWPVLTALGLAKEGAAPGELIVCSDARDAVDGAEFIQESVPERIALKHELYAAIEPVLSETTVVASSASGLTLTEMQAGWRDPARFVLGHPFNPPHVIPLVEVMGNERTDPEAVSAARSFYESVGKVTIEVKREVPGHVANRLQAALWREAIHLVMEGVASVEDVDTAVAAGPGLRWGVMGPTTLFHLGGGEGGLASFCDRYTDSFNRWWDDLGQPHLTPEVAETLVAGLKPLTTAHSIEELSATRDALLTKYIAASRAARQEAELQSAGAADQG